MTPVSALLLAAALTLPAAAAPRKAKAAPPRRPAPVRKHARARKAPAVELLHPPVYSTAPISFVSPPEGLVLSADHEFVLGGVAYPKALFTINGTTVAVHKDGGFLAYLPVSQGTFTFHAELAVGTATVTADRSIFVPPAPQPLPPGKLAIDPSSLQPSETLELRAGDWWTAKMKATPGERAFVRAGSGPWREMRETDRRLGVYQADLQVRPGETFGPAKVRYRIGTGWSSVTAEGTALVSATDAQPEVAVVRPASNGYASVKIWPDEGFLAFPPSGTRFLATGRRGSSVRVEFAPGLSGWILSKDVALSTAAAPPGAVSANISATVSADAAVIRVPLTDRVPFLVTEDPARDRVTLRLYWTHSHTNWINYQGLEDFVAGVSWRQESSDVMAVEIRLKPGRRVWGWRAEDDGGGVKLTLRRPPVVNPRRPLAGLRIMLDPGHTSNPHDGATGPLGTREPVANYAIAQALAARLKRAGAVPLITRASLTDDVPLTKRPVLAEEEDADLFVSLHNNALPDGADPFSVPHGFMIFYYHPHSEDLARALHGSFVKEVPLADEGLKWGNLLVARLTDMPAVLVENAMLILPEQEALLNDPAFRDKLARALEDGLKDFVRRDGARGRR
jgi:N-acetylmuramoyl-L-alanine amidase